MAFLTFHDVKTYVPMLKLKLTLENVASLIAWGVVVSLSICILFYNDPRPLVFTLPVLGILCLIFRKR